MSHRSAAGLGAVLLAAGGSSRLGRPKQFVEVGGEALVRRQANLLLGLEPACVVVVSGAEAQSLAPLLADLPVEQIHNPDWQRGMGSSLACGIRAMPERARAALVLLCDQWRLEAADLERLVAAWAAEPLAAVIADYGGASGPPAILPRALFDRLARLRGDRGAKRILERWKGKLIRVPMAAAASDIDRAGDLPLGG